MDHDFTKEELQHIMILMNSSSDADCEMCSSIRKKLESQIENLTFFNTGEE